jgi:hypothetical protein
VGILELGLDLSKRDEASSSLTIAVRLRRIEFVLALLILGARPFTGEDLSNRQYALHTACRPMVDSIPALFDDKSPRYFFGLGEKGRRIRSDGGTAT